jgi:hypothetical protein
MIIYAIICHLKSRGFSLITYVYKARPIFIKYGINTGSIQIKTRCRKNGRNTFSCFHPVSIFFRKYGNDRVKYRKRYRLGRNFTRLFSTLDVRQWHTTRERRERQRRILFYVRRSEEVVGHYLYFRQALEVVGNKVAFKVLFFYGLLFVVPLLDSQGSGFEPWVTHL